MRDETQAPRFVSPSSDISEGETEAQRSQAIIFHLQLIQLAPDPVPHGEVGLTQPSKCWRVVGHMGNREHLGDYSTLALLFLRALPSDLPSSPVLALSDQQ